MIKITLFCASGMSTSMLIDKMQIEAKKQNLEVAIKAFPEAEMAKRIDGVDAVLLGPQIRYALNKAKKLCESKGIPVELINAADYGLMSGAKVLAQALRLVQKK